MTEPEQITVENVLETLDELDEQQKQAVQEAANKAATAAAAEARRQVEEELKARKPEPTTPDPKKPEGQQDEATLLAWEMADEAVAETCPDLDEETRAIVKAGATGPRDYKAKAKALQAKIVAKKTPADETEEQKRKLAEQIFDGGGGGGNQDVTKPKKPTTEEKLKEAVEKNDSRGILKGVVEKINDGKMFQRGVTVVMD